MVPPVEKGTSTWSATCWQGTPSRTAIAVRSDSCRATSSSSALLDAGTSSSPVSSWAAQHR